MTEPGLPVEEEAMSRARADALDVVSLVNVVLRHRRLIVLVVLLVMVPTLVVQLRRPLAYTSSASFLPQGNSAASGAAGIAAQLGFSIGAAGGGAQSPAFYTDLARSREILGAVADHAYTVGGAKTTLSQILNVPGGTPAERRAETIRSLERIITADFSARTSIVTIKATAQTPELAQQLAAQVLEELNRFNLDRRQSQAAAERTFAENRLNEVRADLVVAENRLQDFLTHNRDYRGSPELSAQADRLTRDVLFRQQLYTTFAQAFEQAKIEQVRDTPVTTVIESPELPIKPEARGRLRILLFAIVGSLAAAVLLAFLHESFERTMARGDAWREFVILRGEVGRDLRQPWRMLSARRPPSTGA